MPAKIAVIYYSTYGHVQTLAKSVIEGAVEAGAEVTEFQFPETLPSSVLEKMHAAPKSDIPVIKPEDMTKFDGFLLGFPTRYGRAPAQVSSFFDATGAQWASGALAGKLAGIFVCTAGQHGGQETTAYSTLPILAHHGMTYVPLGYCDPSMYALDVVNGGSAWGASTLAGGDGSRQVTDMEKNIGKMQGSAFAKICARCAPQAPLPSESKKAKIAVISYSTYGHIAALSQSVVQGLREEGAEVTEFQIGETLPEEVLAKMHAPPKSSLPVIQASDMVNFDGFLFGIPTRYGRASAQVSTFFDSTGQQWASGALRGKFAGVFTSTAGQHGGQETTTLTTIPFFTHHAMNFVPLGYPDPSMYLLSEAQGGSPWGASTLAGGQGERSVSDLEKNLGCLQGKAFARRVNQWVQSE